MKTATHLFVLLGLLLGFTALHAQPTANFTADRVSGCSPLTVNFTSTSSGSPTSYLWTFGNGNTSANQNPSATYVLPGTYTVSLTVADAVGNNTKTVNAYITVYANPVADFSGTPLTGCVPLNVNFNNLSTGSAAITDLRWDFGNGNTGTGTTPSTIYGVAGSYPVTLAITDANGCVSNTTKPAYVTASPGFTADFTAINNVSCSAPATVSFIPSTSAPGSYTYKWKFGNNTTSTAANPSCTYSSPGTYTVTLEVTSSTGCVQTVTKTGFVQIADLQSSFTYSTTSSCAPAIVFLTNTSSPGLSTLTHTWQLNGAQNRYAQNTNYTLTGKTSVITLTVQNSGGCTSTSSQTITLADPPEANFVADKTVFCDYPATVNFTNTSSSAATSWAWNYGNNVGGTTRDGIATYRAEGVYTVRLIASSTGTCKDTAYATIIVSKPNVVIKDKNLKNGCIPTSFQIEAIDYSYQPMTTWNWELNGETVSTSRVFTHHFSDGGVYVFKLTATNNHGCKFIDYDTIRVGSPPKADFSINPQVVCLNPGKVSLSHFKLDTTTIHSYKWEFVNGNNITIISTDTNPSIRFTDTGYYTVTLTVFNFGCPYAITKPFSIKVNNPKAEFKYRIDSCAFDTVWFTNMSIGRNRYKWEFIGSGAISTLANPLYVYTTPGFHHVRLIANDTTTGCYDTTTQSIFIRPGPKLSFTPTDTSVCMGSSATFNNTSILDSTQKVASIVFDCTDGTSIANNPADFTFNKSGVYGMKMTITDSLGCNYKYTDSSVVKVYETRAGFRAMPTAGCSPMLVLVTDTTYSENVIISRKWVFTPTDSIIGNNANSSFIYLKPAANQTAGTTLKLTTIDNKGCTYTTSKIIKNTRPVPEYDIVLTKSCGFDSFDFVPVFKPESAMGPLAFNWSLPEGTINSIGSIQRQYTGDTSFTVQMVITDGQGCKDSISKTVRVNTKAPKIGFTATPREIACYKSQPLVVFTDTSVSGGSPIIRRDWNLGQSDNIFTKIGKDSTTARTFYVKPGRYAVSLKVTDSIGCSDSTTIPDFIVAGGPYGSYSFTPNRGCNPVEVDFSVVSPNSALYIWDHADGNVDTLTTLQHSYQYNREGVYYPRLTLVDSTLTCDYGFDAIDSIVVLPLPKPDFDADQKVVCVNRPVMFTNQTKPHPFPINNWKWILSPKDSSYARNPAPLSYPVKGFYTISLEATDSNGCYGKIVKDSFIAVMDDSIPPAMPVVKRASVLNNEEVIFEYLPNTEFDFGKYIIYTSTNQYTQTNINDTSLVETGLNTLDNPYAYKMIAVDVCQNISEYSETHQTIELKASAAANKILLNWTPYIGFDTSKYYEVWRTTPEENHFTYLAKVDGNTTTYADTSVLCKQPYFYRIRAVETDTLYQHSYSDTAGAIPIYSPVLPTPQNIRATVVNNKVVRLEWHAVPYQRSFTYHIYKSIDDGAPVFFKQLSPSDTFLTDKNVTVQEHSYTYTTYLVDACGAQSEPSNIAKTILLKVRMVGNDILKHDPELTWSAYDHWALGVNHYMAEFYNDEARNIQVVAVTDSVTRMAKHRYVNLIQPDYCYKITAFQHGDTSIFSESNINCVSTAPRLYAPNVFTVNNDNLNDKFYVRGIFIEKFELKIYNRWGQLVFETTDMNEGWDGSFNGQPCKPDVFVYLAQGVGNKGQQISISGNVTLLR